MLSHLLSIGIFLCRLFCMPALTFCRREGLSRLTERAGTLWKNINCHANSNLVFSSLSFTFRISASYSCGAHTSVWQNWRFSAPQTHLWLIKHWFSASTFVVKFATFAKPQKTLQASVGRQTAKRPESQRLAKSKELQCQFTSRHKLQHI